MTTAQDFHFSLLENGLDFVLSAIEHLTLASVGQPDQKRQLKYAVLHLSSGIELILKERLRVEHWSLLFKDVNKADETAYSSGDFVSATYQEVLDRLAGISAVIIEPKRKRQLDDLRKRRNRLEHFGTAEGLLAALASTSAMASFIFDFIEENFDEAQKSEEEIYLEEIKESLVKCTAIVTERWKEIKQSVDGAFATAQCPRCGHEAASIDAGEVRCFFATK
jgi:hypothetical protein